MSEWSSFEDDRALSEAWSSFKDGPVPIEEGFFDTLKSMTGASGTLQQLLATTTIKDYFKVYRELLRMWVTSHKGDPRLKATARDYLENFEEVVYLLQRDPELKGRARRAIQSVADFGDKQLRSRSHLLNLAKTDTSYVSPLAPKGGKGPDPLEDPDVSFRTDVTPEELVSRLAAAQNLEEYGEMYRFIARELKKPDQWEAIMGELRNGTDPTQVATAVSSFDAPAGGAAHKQRFIELARAEFPTTSATTSSDEEEQAPEETETEQLIFRLKPLSQKLKKAGISTAGIVAIMKTLKQQLQANDVPVRLQEDVDNLIHQLLVEVQNADLNLIDEKDKKKKKLKKKKKSSSSKKKKSSVTASEKARRAAQSKKAKQQNQKPSKKKKSKQKDKKQQAAATPDSETPEPEKDDFYKRKAAASSTIPPELRPEKGKIKLKALIAYLRTIDPNLNKKSRRKAVKIVRKHLVPYVEKYNLKLAEHQIDRLSYRLAEELQKLGLLL